MQQSNTGPGCCSLSRPMNPLFLLSLKPTKLKEEESLGGESYGHFCACFVKVCLWAFTEYWSSWLFQRRNAVSPASWVRRLNKKEAYWVVQNYTARLWWRQGIPNTLPATLTIYFHWPRQHLYSLKLVCFWNRPSWITVYPMLLQEHMSSLTHLLKLEQIRGVAHFCW